ncbi:protein fantom, partial [Caerostris extrusa]
CAETEHLETLHRLDNVKEMLTTQGNINKVGQEEMKSLTEKLEEQQKEHLSQLQEYSHLLDLRAARIQKLENQLNDIAYGTSTMPSSMSDLVTTINSVVSALKPHFNFTSQYVVEIDDYFLCYLHGNVITLELHESLGKIHGKQKLIGTGKRKDVDFGTIEYWTHQKDVQPTTFSVYKFYELPDQDTTIVPASNNPEFSAHHIFSVFIDPAFEKYIMTENLYIYVFDDNDPDISAHIGRASIPLQPLAQK